MTSPIHIAVKAWHSRRAIWITLPCMRMPIWSSCTPSLRPMWVIVRHRVLRTHIVELLVSRRASSPRILLHECYVIRRFGQ
ncbi:hypothetical protein FH972_019977 [Carpinus fangiana]|uniref:Uncharacterized protein n=1 Tax=Carpinus fangiana TaxID=176857 RepID=A0A5N6RV99_9ROSI|nr:hypothetical protein FH972_019977 [Carpinus fangiana]